MHSFRFYLLAVALTSATTFASTLHRGTKQVCGATGYSSGTDAWYYNEDNSEATYKACSTGCGKQSDCKSFAFGAGVCMYFDVTLDGNLDLASDSPFTFYDASCVSTTTTTTTTTTKTPATSTTTKATTNQNPSTITTKSSIKTTTTSSTTTTTKATTKTTPTTTTTTRSTTAAKTTTTTMFTTTKKATTTSSKAKTSSTTSSISIPAGCTVAPSYTVSSIYWHNSTHNLDCVNGPDLGDGTGCLDENGNWCDPNLDKTCTHCGIGVCMTGLPLQPVGYGPPDTITVTFGDGSGCTQTNPVGYRRHVVGDDVVGCGNAYPFLAFYGDSNGATDAGLVQVNDPYGTCKDGSTITAFYQGRVNLDCTHDAYFNATCTSTGTATIPLVSVQVSSNS